MSNRKLSYLTYFYDTVPPIKKADTSITNASACSKYLYGFQYIYVPCSCNKLSKLFTAESLFIKVVG